MENETKQPCPQSDGDTLKSKATELAYDQVRETVKRTDEGLKASPELPASDLSSTHS